MSRARGHPRISGSRASYYKKCRLDRIRNRRASKIARIFPVLDSRHPHLPPQLEQNLLFTLADGLAADAPFPGQIVLAAAVPEELADQASVKLGQAAQGGLQACECVCIGSGSFRGGAVGDRLAGPGASAEAHSWR